MPPDRRHFLFCTYLLSVFSQAWFAMPQLVLQADWQEVWHSPQPPFLALSHRLRVSMVTICSMIDTSQKNDQIDFIIKLENSQLSEQRIFKKILKILLLYMYHITK